MYTASNTYYIVYRMNMRYGIRNIEYTNIEPKTYDVTYRT